MATSSNVIEIQQPSYDSLNIVDIAIRTSEAVRDKNGYIYATGSKSQGGMVGAIPANARIFVIAD